MISQEAIICPKEDFSLSTYPPINAARIILVAPSTSNDQMGTLITTHKAAL
jgi:hypothetical protein